MANLDEEQRRIQEHKELLKLKQGIIEESEIIPEDGYAEIPKLHGWKRVENFLYHNKWFVIIGVFAVLVLGYMTFQTFTREKEDLYVLAISTTNRSGIYTKQTDIEKALEKYCPDFDGNGYVHVGVNYMNLSTENGYTEVTDASRYKFMAETMTGDSQMFLTDTGIFDELYSNGETEEAGSEEYTEDEIRFFMDFSEEYPEAALYEGAGLQLNTTEWKTDARWETCPDIVLLFVRGEYADMTGNTEDAKTQRERAKIVFQNILEGNVVNPDLD